MGRIVNTTQLIEQANSNINSNINSRYDIWPKNIEDIVNTSRTSYDMVVKGFRFGYMQGMKATRAEGRKQA